jgi:flagellin-like protein
MKILRSKKALSPVVASIILIAVTVAVSIAVAAWMGALTFTFMKTEEIAFTAEVWGVDHINITMTTRSDVVFSGARVDDKIVTCYHNGTFEINSGLLYVVPKGKTVTIQVMNVGTPAVEWAAGLPYKITIVTQTSQYPWTGNAHPPSP